MKLYQVCHFAMHCFLSSPPAPHANGLKQYQEMHDDCPPTSDASESEWKSWVDHQALLLVHEYVLMKCLLTPTGMCRKLIWGKWVDQYYPGWCDELCVDKEVLSHLDPAEEPTMIAGGVGELFTLPHAFLMHSRLIFRPPKHSQNAPGNIRNPHGME